MNKNVLNITGQKFGTLTVVARDPINSKSGNAKWICRCDCGNTASVVGSKLRSGHSKTCGCIRFTEKAQGHSGERIYRIWTCMQNRCNKENNDNYKWYGGRGIKICTSWDNFLNFREWALQSGYNDDLSIDRIDPNLDYFPDNCRWVSMKFQANNKTNNRILKYEGKSYTESQFADNFNLSYHTVVNRLRMGWNLSRIVNTPERDGKVK